MKKIYLLFAFSSFLFTVNAQSALALKDITSSGSPIANGSTINETTTAGLITAHLFEIKNTSATTQTIIVRRYDDLLNSVSASDNAVATFCLGTACYPPNVFTASVVLAANATATLTTDLEEASVVGISTVRYKVYDANNSVDAIIFTLNYNGPVSVKNIASVFYNVSDVYPNPSASIANINLTVSSSSTNVKISVLNSLGSIVLTKDANLNIGKNIISIDVENLPTGLYFINISQGNQKITKKITINK